MQVLQTLADASDLCRSKVLAKSRLFTWVVFNALIGNSDAHLKNLSFLVLGAGIELAPFYDLLSVAVYDTRVFADKAGAWPNTTLAWPILGVQRFGDLTHDVLLDAADALGLGRVPARRTIQTLSSRIDQEAEALYNEFLADNQALVEHNPDLIPVLAAEDRLLRTVRYTIINDTVRMLS